MITLLRDWVVSVFGSPVFHEIYENPNYSGGVGNRYSTVTVQYDWAFILAALIFLICLWGFISIVRMMLGRWRKH